MCVSARARFAKSVAVKITDFSHVTHGFHGDGCLSATRRIDPLGAHRKATLNIDQLEAGQ